MGVQRDTAFNLAGAFAPVLVTLVVTPYYLHVIGADRFGIVAICWTMIGALGFASLGMGPALTYRLALLDAGSPAERSNHVWSALLIGLVASLLGAFALIAIARAYFLRFANLPASLNSELSAAFPFLAALLPLATLSGILNGAIQGRKRFDALSAIAVLNATLVAITPLLAAVVISVRLPSLMLAIASANALVLLVQFALCTRIVPLRLQTRLRTEHARELVHYGAWMSGTALVAPLLLLVDRLVIGAVRGPGAVTVYVLAFNLLQGVLLLPASLSSAMLPTVASLAREEEVREQQSRSLDWLNGLLTPMVICAIAFSSPFFRLWIGPTLGSSAGLVAVILLVGCWAHGIGHIPSTVVVGRGRPDLLTKLLLACLVPYIVILYWATLRFGVIGAAAAWTIRAAFDPMLFAFTRPRPSDLAKLRNAALLVISAMATAVLLGWTSGSYWAVMGLILATSCFQNRGVIISSVNDLRYVAFRAR